MTPIWSGNFIKTVWIYTPFFLDWLQKIWKSSSLLGNDQTSRSFPSNLPKNLTEQGSFLPPEPRLRTKHPGAVDSTQRSAFHTWRPKYTMKNAPLPFNKKKTLGEFCDRTHVQQTASRSWCSHTYPFISWIKTVSIHSSHSKSLEFYLCPLAP